ncbi:MAG: NAD(P)-dependent oxidoreductase, partial [Gammaproteobacteria bacterium]
MEKIDLVCLCDLYNLKEFFGEYFAVDNPWINLLLPEEVNNPESIQHALAFSPGPKAFEAYPNLRLVSCAGAGVDALLDNPGLKADVVVSRVVIAEQAQMIAGFAIWYIHGWQRRMWEYTSLQSAKDWHPINRTPPSAFPVGILGCGKIGGTLARTLQALGYPVTAYGNTSRVEEDLTILS